MTYLELVNRVLRRLREREVASVSQTAYSKLIGDFVNDAKQEVEEAWDWSALRTTQTITTSNGVSNYTLTGLGNGFSIDSFVNDTSNTRMDAAPSAWIEEKYLMNPQNGSPKYYRFRGESSSGDTKIDLFPIPDGVYSLKMDVVKRPAELSADTDTLLVPVLPVVLLAWARAIEERGEDGGANSMNAFKKGSDALADSISAELGLNPYKAIWNTV